MHRGQVLQLRDGNLLVEAELLSNVYIAENALTLYRWGGDRLAPSSLEGARRIHVAWIRPRNAQEPFLVAWGDGDLFLTGGGETAAPPPPQSLVSLIPQNLTEEVLACVGMVPTPVLMDTALAEHVYLAPEVGGSLRPGAALRLSDARPEELQQFLARELPTIFTGGEGGGGAPGESPSLQSEVALLINEACLWPLPQRISALNKMLEIGLLVLVPRHGRAGDYELNGMGNEGGPGRVIPFRLRGGREEEAEEGGPWQE
jgi:hypothetical protein